MKDQVRELLDDAVKIVSDVPYDGVVAKVAALPPAEGSGEQVRWYKAKGTFNDDTAYIRRVTSESSDLYWPHDSSGTRLPFYGPDPDTGSLWDDGPINRGAWLEIPDPFAPSSPAPSPAVGDGEGHEVDWPTDTDFWVRNGELFQFHHGTNGEPQVSRRWDRRLGWLHPRDSDSERGGWRRWVDPADLARLRAELEEKGREIERLGYQLQANEGATSTMESQLNAGIDALEAQLAEQRERAEDRVWDEVVAHVQGSLPAGHSGAWSESPVELLTDIINDRDEIAAERDALAQRADKAEARVTELTNRFAAHIRKGNPEFDEAWRVTLTFTEFREEDDNGRKLKLADHIATIAAERDALRSELAEAKAKADAWDDAETTPEPEVPERPPMLLAKGSDDWPWEWWVARFNGMYWRSEHHEYHRLHDIDRDASDAKAVELYEADLAATQK